jgi:hypothetical protein
MRRRCKKIYIDAVNRAEWSYVVWNQEFLNLLIGGRRHSWIVIGKRTRRWRKRPPDLDHVHDILSYMPPAREPTLR